MVGSHNSYTYLKGTKFNEMYSRFWRCQTKSIDEQYDLGVRFFDIRVCRDESRGRKLWSVCHGSSKFNQTWINLKAIGSIYSRKFPEAIFRVILESGSEEDEAIFTAELDKLTKSYKNCMQGIIKKGWRILYWNSNFTAKLNDYCCHLFNWDPAKSTWKNIKQLKLSANSIKKYAAEHNPLVTLDMINDKSTIYFMDYV